MSGPFRRFARSRRASALVGFALALPVLLGAAAFGVDAGVLFLERRALQKAVDAAALAAALQPATEALAAARRMVDANGGTDAAVAVRFGRWRSDASLDPDERFAESEDGNAVAVEASRRVPTLFARIFDRADERIGARAEAVVLPTVSFAVGSRLASVDPPLVDAMLQPLVGSGLGLSVMDYRGLARSEVRADALLRALAAAGGMPPTAQAGEVLGRPILLSAALAATAGELDRAGDRPGAAALRKAARAMGGVAVRVVPGDLLGLDDPDLAAARLDYPNRALAARVSALSLLSAAVTDRSIGKEASVRLGLPGLVEAEARVLIGEGESKARALALGNPASASAETAQLRARIAFGTGSAIAGARLNVPLELVAAGARAEVLSATCSSDPAAREVKIAVRPGVVRLSLGESAAALERLAIDGTPRPAALVSAPLVRVEGSATATLRQTTPVVVTFRGAEIGNGTVKTARTRTFAQSFVAGLFADTELQVKAGPLGLGLPLAAAPVRALLAGLAGPVDDALAAVLAVAGIGLGEADVRVDDLVCANARIVG